MAGRAAAAVSEVALLLLGTLPLPAAAVVQQQGTQRGSRRSQQRQKWRGRA